MSVCCKHFAIVFYLIFQMISALSRDRCAHTGTHSLLINLACSELLFSLGIPIVVTTRLTIDWTLGDPLCKLVNYTEFVCGMSSLLSLATISVDRLLCVRQGGQLRLSTTVTKLIIVIIWIISLVFSAPVAVAETTLTASIGGSDFQICTSNQTSNGRSSSVASNDGLLQNCTQFCQQRVFCGVSWPHGFDAASYLISIAILCFFVPTVITCACYAYIYVIVMNSSRNITRQSQASLDMATCGPSMTQSSQYCDRSQPPPHPHRRPTTTASSCHVIEQPRPSCDVRRRQDRLVRLTSAIVLTFFLMWLPFFVISNLASSQTRVSSTALTLTLILAHSNACVNPLLYGYFHPACRRQREQRRCLKGFPLECFRCCCCCYSWCFSEGSVGPAMNEEGGNSCGTEEAHRCSMGRYTHTSPLATPTMMR
ncbi:somatostatin receptor type 5-like [Aplysia californica]|uniref:Somatostatin receptor type 5-like n=1 Tax=Aplysia californica TaxID=6500 RepID=A0ABM1AEU1_APLCA|nr:somatostatin receptor type 5-like [Aplysia californica]